jgi:thiol:disulfide interchange protein
MIRFLVPLFALLVSTVSAAPEYPAMGPDIYDVRANGTEQIAAALKEAKSGNKRVLVDIGTNWCIWCRRLHDTFTTNAQVRHALSSDYVLVMIDLNMRHGKARNADVDRRYGHPLSHGIPVLLVLDADGNLLTTKDSGELEDGHEAHDPAKISAFLAEWAPKH